MDGQFSMAACKRGDAALIGAHDVPARHAHVSTRYAHAQQDAARTGARTRSQHHAVTSVVTASHITMHLLVLSAQSQCHNVNDTLLRAPSRTTISPQIAIAAPLHHRCIDLPNLTLLNLFEFTPIPVRYDLA